jgi:hypothetical protein
MAGWWQTAEMAGETTVSEVVSPPKVGWDIPDDVDSHPAMNTPLLLA